MLKKYQYYPLTYLRCIVKYTLIIKTSIHPVTQPLLYPHLEVMPLQQVTVTIKIE